MPNHTVLQVLEDVNVVTDDAADKDCIIPFEAVMDCLDGRKSTSWTSFSFF